MKAILIIFVSAITLSANAQVGMGTTKADGLQVNLQLAKEISLDSSNVRIGVFGTPRILLDNSGNTLFEMDNYNGRFRLFNPGSERFTITSNGYAGFGTGSPRSTLDVYGGNLSVTGSDNNGTLVAGSSAGTAYIGSNTLTTGIAISPAGNIGIGISTPRSSLDIWGGSVFITGSDHSGTLVGGSSAGTAYIGCNSLSNGIAIYSNGNIGIGTSSPSGLLHVYKNSDVWHTFIGGSSGQLKFAGQTANGSLIQSWNPSSNSARDLYLQRDGGKVGIGTTQPGSTLDINGSLGVSGSINIGGDAVIYGNVAAVKHFSIGSGANAYPLDVEGYTNFNSPYNYYDCCSTGPQTCHTCIGKVSIIASNNVMAAEYDVISDERIKNIKGISNPTEDLAVLNSLKITDYTMKDAVTYGAKPFKKVIAQEVEKVFPQVVSRNINYIPNVYMLTSKI